MNTPRPRAFTLLEVLVCIGIVAMLAGLLLPALARAGGSARTLKCRSNLRQLFVSAEAYAMRNDDRYPVAIRYENTGGVRIIAWDYEHAPDGSVSLGPLWKRVIDPHHVHQCPECNDHSTFGNDPYTGYNYNTTYIAGEATFPNFGWQGVRPGLTRAQWRRVETTAVFGDGGWSGGANKFMRAPMNTVEGDLQTVYAGGQAFRHGGQTNVCYLDGHLDTVGNPRPGLLATDQLLREVMDFPANGFLSDDDSAYNPR